MLFAPAANAENGYMFSKCLGFPANNRKMKTSCSELYGHHAAILFKRFPMNRPTVALEYVIAQRVRVSAESWRHMNAMRFADQDQSNDSTRTRVVVTCKSNKQIFRYSVNWVHIIRMSYIQNVNEPILKSWTAWEQVTLGCIETNLVGKNPDVLVEGVRRANVSSRQSRVTWCACGKFTFLEHKCQERKQRMAVKWDKIKME